MTGPTHRADRGTFPIDDFSEQFHIELPREPFHTLAGLVFDRLGRMPKVGDQVRIDGLRLRVLTVKGLRISLLEATFPQPPAATRVPPGA